MKMIGELDQNSHSLERRSKQYRKVCNIAAKNGYKVQSPESEYKNQNSKLKISCNYCFNAGGQCISPTIRADKLVQGQGCRVTRYIRGAQKRKTHYLDIKNSIEKSTSLRLVTTHDEYTTTTKKSLKLKCPTNHPTFVASYYDVMRTDGKATNCPYCSRSKSEALVLSVVEYLFQADLETEYNPDWLQEGWPGGRLRFDGFAERIPVAKLKQLSIAVEHHGPHHYKPYSYGSKLSVASEYKRQKQSDEHKRDCCKRRSNTRLIEVSDISKLCHQQAVSATIQSIKKSVPEAFNDQEFLKRCKNVKRLSRKRLLLKYAHSSTIEERVSNEITKFGHRFISIDANTGIVTALCGVDGHGKWSGHAHNIIYHNRKTRNVIGCKKCILYANANRDRTPEKGVIQLARGHGFVPEFESGTYRRNSQKLPWKCMKCGTRATRSITSICDHGCPKCKLLVHTNAKQRKLFEKVRPFVTKRGDVLVTQMKQMPTNTKSMVTCKCKRTGGCGKNFRQKIEKIVLGQLHGCDKGSRIWVTRRRLS